VEGGGAGILGVNKLRGKFGIMRIFGFLLCMLVRLSVKVKVKQSYYTPWRCLGGEEV
jgi:hypothetical protein